ncbi:MAG: hypothetical protein LAO79_08650 [Acidobacteriia bacterium]|nr:hypothetical protein [Terriglobia bacterium]
MNQSRGLLLACIFGSIGFAQTTNVDLSVNASVTDVSSIGTIAYAQADVAPLGVATITINSTQFNGTSTAVGLMTFSFNRLGSFGVITNVPLDSSGTISNNITSSQGTGVYANAIGSVNLTLTSAPGGFTLSGTGTVTAGGKTTPFTVAPAHATTTTFPANSMSGRGLAQIAPLASNAEATFSLAPVDADGTLSGTIGVNVTFSDRLIFHFIAPNGKLESVSAVVTGGTGIYATATGSATLAVSANGNNYTLTGSASITQRPLTAPLIREVATAFGNDEVAQNTWIAIKGANLVPANTPAAGVDWSGAPEFMSNRMPTQLQGINVTVNERSAYVYFYCSAVTNPAACPLDQINVLTPPDVTQGPIRVVVNNNGTPSTPFVVTKREIKPSFLLFNTLGYIVATHLDYTLVGPASLYPGKSTPAKAGETIVLYAIGFGLPSTPIVAGSATQFGPLPQIPDCFLGTNQAQVTAAYVITPGLTQLNVVVPAGAPPGDNLFYCQYQRTASASQFTPAGNLITVQ